MKRPIAATALIVALSCSTAYASRVEVGAQPPTEPTKYIALPDVIEVVDELHEEPEEKWESLGTWKLTAYCPLECCNGNGRAWTTASGAQMVIGDTVATGRLPFGTKLKINGHIYTVTDRGVPYGTVDILHESNSAARKFGIRHAEVWIKR